MNSFRFDDCTVTPIATEFVLKKQPYLLYYRRTSPNPLLGGVPRSVTPSKSPSPKTPSPKPLLEPSRIVIGPKRPSPTPPKSPFGEKGEVWMVVNTFSVVRVMAVRQRKLQQSRCKNGSHFLAVKGRTLVHETGTKIY